MSTPDVRVSTRVHARFDIADLKIRMRILRERSMVEVQLTTMTAVWVRIKTGHALQRPWDVTLDVKRIGAKGTPIKKDYRLTARLDELKPELRKLLDEFDPAAAEKEDRGE